jgi:hypothetical protein
LMESRVVKRIEEIYRQDARFTERKEDRSSEKLPGNPRISLWTLGDLGVLAVNSLRLGENRLTILESITAVLIRMAHGLRSGRLGRDPAILQKLGHDPAYVDPIKTSRVLSERKPL